MNLCGCVCMCVLLTCGLRNSYKEQLSREMFVIDVKRPWRCEDCWHCGIACSFNFMGKSHSWLLGSKKKLWRGECKARPSGWLGKGVTGGDFPFLSHCFTYPYSHLFLACIGFGLSFRQEPAADVTILPVKTTNESIAHHHVRHTPDLQEMCFSFLQFPFCFPLSTHRRMSSTLLLPDFFFHVLLNQPAHSHSDKKGMLHHNDD